MKFEDKLASLPIKRQKIAIQGYEGCFHQQAAYNYFGEEIEIFPCNTFRELAAMVEDHSVDAGVMAIENSIAGSILPNYSLLQNYSLKITGETYLSITQNLMALPGTKLEDVKEVHSHPIAILQCVEFLESLGHNRFKIVESVDTALSAKEVRDDKLEGVAAIAGELAAKLYGLEIIEPSINSVKNNITRFLILERADKAMPNMNINKASLYFEVAHTGGSLLTTLRCFESSNINMTKLQSYPIPENPFNYLFHMDIEFGDVADFEKAIKYARMVCEDLSICGVYTKGNNI